MIVLIVQLNFTKNLFLIIDKLCRFFCFFVLENIYMCHSRHVNVVPFFFFILSFMFCLTSTVFFFSLSLPLFLTYLISYFAFL